MKTEYKNHSSRPCLLIGTLCTGMFPYPGRFCSGTPKPWIQAAHYCSLDLPKVREALFIYPKPLWASEWPFSAPKGHFQFLAKISLLVFSPPTNSEALPEVRGAQLLHLQSIGGHGGSPISLDTWNCGIGTVSKTPSYINSLHTVWNPEKGDSQSHKQIPRALNAYSIH